MILSFFHLYSWVILLVSLFYSCFRYFNVFINFIGDILKIIVKRYWIALEIALYKFSIIIIIIISLLTIDRFFSQQHNSTSSIFKKLFLYSEAQGR